MKLKSDPFCTSERFTSVTIGVRISCNGAGMSKNDINNALYRIAKSANGHSSTRHASAVCGELYQEVEGKFYR